MATKMTRRRHKGPEDPMEDAMNGSGKGLSPSKHRRKSKPLEFRVGNVVINAREAVLMLSSNVLVALLVWLFTVSSQTHMPLFFAGNTGVDGKLARFLQQQTTHRNGHARDPPHLQVEPVAPRKVTPVPSTMTKTFYYDGQKISFPIARALRSRGWQRVDEIEDAQLVYTYKQNEYIAKELEPYQRFNLIPNADNWNSKWSFVLYQKQWEKARQQQSLYIPESYMLTDSPEQTDEFEKRLLEKDGVKYPWLLKAGDINQGKGITVLAPNSPELLAVPKQARSGEWDDEDYIVQKYVCNEMTWNRRKFDVRVFWLVASLDPLVILYHDGYVRIGNSDYSETDFSNTQAHLTTHTKLGAEGKATWGQFGDALQDLMTKKGIRKFPGGSKAIDHVRNQIKASLAEMVEIFKPSSFVPHKSLPTDNSFSFYCADFILDNDLDVWFLEPQYGCGLDEDYYFRLEMHASLFNGMVDVLEEVWKKQESGKEHLLPLQKAGNYEVVHAAGRSFVYDGYERNHNKASCKAGGSK